MEKHVLSKENESQLQQALDRAVQWLLDHQDAEGWWCGELETNVTMTAEHVLLLRFLELETNLDRIREGAIRHILHNQRADGSWALYFDGPADLSTTIEAYVALKVLGVDPANEAMRRALAIIHQLGGVAKARVFTKIWLALFGEYPWSGIPTMPPELIYLPPNVPFNLYDFACWARGTIAPLLIVISRRPVKPLGCSVPELVVPGTEGMLTRVPGSGIFWWADKLLKLYETSPWKLGWYPTALGLFADCPVPGGHGCRFPGHAQRNRGTRGFLTGRRDGVAFSSLYVSGLGYCLGNAGSTPRRYPARSSCYEARGPVAPAGADFHGW